MKENHPLAQPNKFKFILVTVLILGLSGLINKAFGQTVLYTTDFGTTANVNPANWTFTGIGMNTSTNTPSNHTGASGGVYLGEGNSVTFTNTSGTSEASSPVGTSEAILLVSTTNYSNITLGFAMRKSSASYNANATYTLSWSTDGTTYTDITYTEASAGNWGLASGSGLALPAAASNQSTLYFKWTFVRTGTGSNFKIDDVSVTGGSTLPPAAISFVTNDTTVAENINSANVILKLTASSTFSSAISVSASVLSNASASDYSLSVATVTFAANAVVGSTAAITLSLTNDALAESSEYVILRLSNGQNANAGAINQFAFYIGDDDKTPPQASNSLSLNLLSSFSNGITGSNSAEIVAHDPGSQRLFIANSVGARLDIVDFVNPSNPVLLYSVPITTYGNINSVTVKNGIVAAAIEGTNPQDSGSVVFFNVNGVYQNKVKVGMMPDMITFNHAGTKVFTANEGEPNQAYTNDPDGSVSIIDISGGISTLTQSNVAHVTFTVYNGQEATLRSQGIRIFGVNASASQDFEPEYITVAPDDSKAWVGLQENNALVEINLANNSINYLKSLGTKDHNALNNGYDASNVTKEVNIANFPVKGFYMPDAIASYSVGGTTYIISANEGDSRAYTGFTEETRISGGTLDPAKFPNAAELKNNYLLGRLNITNKSGDIDNDGDLDTLYSYGARSFSIWDASTGVQVYDSKDDFEQITATNSFSVLFNASNSNAVKKDRSDDKGPEPEGVTIGMIGSTIYAFIALERTGGVMVYDVTNPAAPTFVTYVNNRSLPSNGPDLGAEGIIFIKQTDSPNGQYIVIAANEVSSTLSIWGIPGCSAPISTSLSVAGASVGACSDNAPVLSVASATGVTYQWSMNGTSIPSATSNTVLANVSGDYSVAITGGTNCAAYSIIKSVSVNPSPTLSITGPTVVCLGGTITQTVTGAANYSLNATSTSSVVFYTPTTSGSFTLMGMATNSCVASLVQQIVVNPIPTLSVSGPTVVCIGGTITQTVSGATSYSLNAISTSSVVLYTPITSGTFTLTGIDANNCVNTLVQQVLVNPTPTLALMGPTVVCLGGTITQTISGATSYSLNTTSTPSVVVYTPTTSGSFTFTGMDANSCVTDLAQQIVVNPIPTLSVSGPTVVCLGGTVTQTLSGATSYSLNYAATPSVVVYTPSASVVYTLTGMNSNGCPSALFQQITVNPLPVINLSAVPSTICAGESTTLTAAGTTSYSWSTGATASSITLAPANTSTYSVTGTNVYSCSVSLSKTVTVNPVPMINVMSSSPLICTGESVSLTASGGTSYLWNNGSASSSILVNPTSTIIYTVTGTNALNCSTKATITQSVSDCTSLSENTLNDVYTIYPNPAVNELKISFPGEAPIGVKFINALGAVVLEEKNYTSASSLSIASLSKGIYFVQMSFRNKIEP